MNNKTDNQDYYKAYDWVLYENALTTDVIDVLKENYHFKRHGKAKVCITYYAYACEWGDNKHVLYAENIENALEKYRRAKGFTKKQIDDIYSDASLDCVGA